MIWLVGALAVALAIIAAASAAVAWWALRNRGRLVRKIRVRDRRIEELAEDNADLTIRNDFLERRHGKREARPEAGDAEALAIARACGVTPEPHLPSAQPEEHT